MFNINKISVEEQHENTQGNTVKNLGNIQADRYKFDIGLGKNWEQFNTPQDASYFGVWINAVTFQVFTYCEGDMSLVECNNQAGFNKEIGAVAEFYKNC